MITTSAPGKVILFGEHAVIYDKLGIASSINKRCQVKIFSTKKKSVYIESKNLGLSKALKERELLGLFRKINSAKNRSRFDEIRKIYKKDKLSPSFFVIANIFKEYGFKGFRIEIDSKIPKNLGSSSAVFAAISFGVLKFLNKKPLKKKISNFAFKGDLITHGGTPSGIDNAVVTYGGYLSYKKSEGTKILEIDFKLPLLIVDSGQESKTAETVSYIRKKKEENPRFVSFILDSLDEISEHSLGALVCKKLNELGKFMFDYYQELKKLEISTKRLDKIVKIALKNGALGAKPTGGWGGGCCLALAENRRKINELVKIFKREGFKSFPVETGVEGVGLI